METNAFLLDISAAGTIDDYGDAAAAGSPAWTGRVPCYITRRRKTSSALRTQRGGGGEMTLEEHDTLVVKRIAGAPVIEAPGDQATGTTVLIEDRRDPRNVVSRRFRVIDVDNRASGTPADGLRLTLTDGRAV